jgi:NUMOD3 motif
VVPTFYTYLWLREDGTPYYVGKGSGYRAFRKGGPEDRTRILLQEFPDEESAFAAEMLLIEFYGRAHLGAGCLHNITDGGRTGTAGMLGHTHSAATKRRMSLAKIGKGKSAITRRRIGLARAGKPLSLAHRRKLSLAAKKRVQRDGTLHQRAAGLKGARIRWEIQ